jgi:hypothetical protein
MTETITLPLEVAKRILRNIEIGNKLSAGIEMRREIEAALEQPQVEQEPVAYYVMNGAALFQLFRSKSQAEALVYDLQKRHDLSGSPAHFHVVPLYTRPQPKRQPLTDEQISAAVYGDTVGASDIEFARAIERLVWEKSNGWNRI